MMFSSSCTLYSPPSRSSLRSLVRMVHRYYGAIRLLQYVHARRTALAFTGRPSHNAKGALEISRFSSMLFSQRARALTTTQDRSATRQ